VHGDIKPQNLLVGDDGVVKIADFGISKILHGSNQKLLDTAGTPAFMSPELCSGESYSGFLADVWALGATMFMIRCGRPPFVASTVLQVRRGRTHIEKRKTI
jgi:serine/threonine protein kinase